MNVRVKPVLGKVICPYGTFFHNSSDHPIELDYCDTCGEEQKSEVWCDSNDLRTLHRECLDCRCLREIEENKVQEFL